MKKRLILLVTLTTTLAACESKSSSQPNLRQDHSSEKQVGKQIDTAFKRDLDRICNAEEQSGALFEKPNARGNHVGLWLATHIESQEARVLSAQLVALAPEERKLKLRETLKSNSMGECPILQTW